MVGLQITVETRRVRRCRNVVRALSTYLVTGYRFVQQVK